MKRFIPIFALAAVALTALALYGLTVGQQHTASTGGTTATQPRAAAPPAKAAPTPKPPKPKPAAAAQPATLVPAQPGACPAGYVPAADKNVCVYAPQAKNPATVQPVTPTAASAPSSGAVCFTFAAYSGQVSNSNPSGAVYGVSVSGTGICLTLLDLNPGDGHWNSNGSAPSVYQDPLSAGNSPASGTYIVEIGNDEWTFQPLTPAN